MHYRLMAAVLLGVGLLLTARPVSVTAADKNTEASKKALQELGEFIGQWKGNGDAKIDGKNAIWKETIDFGWKFAKSGDSWIALDVTDGKFLTKGALKYDPMKKQYVFTATDKDGKETEYTGKVVRSRLVLEGKDKGGDVHRITLYTLADGARLTLQSELKEGGKGLFGTVYKVVANKEGESFAGGGKKKNECVVTGGLGTMAVNFGGKTYYVCCSGCREEFDANPKKYVDEFEKKKK